MIGNVETKQVHNYSLCVFLDTFVSLAMWITDNYVCSVTGGGRVG